MSELESTEFPILATAVTPTTYLLAGAIAGLSVDIVLYPLDTIKTRMQSSVGLINSGGFRNLYSGLFSVAIGSAPSAALFFTSYELMKYQLKSSNSNNNTNNIINNNPILQHSIAASVSELISCLIRVPTENIKQKLQAGLYKTTAQTVKSIYQYSGLFGFYTGYGSTILREIPFSLIQFPLYELIKTKWSIYQQKSHCNSLESAVIGSISGSIAAAITTPLDVIKTRLMLAQPGTTNNNSILSIIQSIYQTEGINKFFSGIQPRVLWIGLGGAVFFGAYETAKSLLLQKSNNTANNSQKKH